MSFPSFPNFASWRTRRPTCRKSIRRPVQLEVNKELLKRANGMVVPAADLDLLIHNDPVADSLSKQVAGLTMELDAMTRSTKPGERNARIEMLARAVALGPAGIRPEAGRVEGEGSRQEAVGHRAKRRPVRGAASAGPESRKKSWPRRSGRSWTRSASAADRRCTSKCRRGFRWHCRRARFSAPGRRLTPRKCSRGRRPRL